MTHSLPKNAVIHRASVREAQMTNIAAYTAETRPVAVRRTVVAVIPSACDWASKKPSQSSLRAL